MTPEIIASQARNELLTGVFETLQRDIASGAGVSHICTLRTGFGEERSKYPAYYRQEFVLAVLRSKGWKVSTQSEGPDEFTKDTEHYLRVTLPPLMSPSIVEATRVLDILAASEPK